MTKTAKNMTLFALTWPIFIELLLHMLMGNADTLMLSQYSDESVAAVGVSNQILSVIIVMFGFVAQGAAVLIAQNLGAEKEKTAGQIAMTSISLNLMIALLLSAALYIWAVPILNIMDLPSEIMGEAKTYMQIVGGLIFVQALIMTTGAILRSYGHTKDTMRVTIVMNILNVIGNYFVIFGPFGFPVLGVAGVAYSTAISRFLGFIVLLSLLIKRTEGRLKFRRFFRYQKNQLKDLLKIGIPSAGEQLSYNAMQMVITYFMAQMGAIALTTSVYTRNIMMFIFLFAMAIGQGSQILIGRYVGAGKMKEAYERGMRSLKISTIISFSTALVIYFASKPILGIFTKDLEIIKTGSFLLFLAIILE